MTGDRPAEHRPKREDQGLRRRTKSVSDSQTLMSCDDAEFKTKGKIARHNQTHSHTTTITESLDSKRDEISQSGAVLQCMRPLSLLGRRKQSLIKY